VQFPKSSADDRAQGENLRFPPTITRTQASSFPRNRQIDARLGCDSKLVAAKRKKPGRSIASVMIAWGGGARDGKACAFRRFGFWRMKQVSKRKFRVPAWGGVAIEEG